MRHRDRGVDIATGVTHRPLVLLDLGLCANKRTKCTRNTVIHTRARPKIAPETGSNYTEIEKLFGVQFFSDNDLQKLKMI